MLVVGPGTAAHRDGARAILELLERVAGGIASAKADLLMRPPRSRGCARLRAALVRFLEAFRSGPAARLEDNMNLTPREKDKLLVAMAAMVARNRLARGVKLNHPEAIALITDFVVEGARDGRPSPT